MRFADYGKRVVFAAFDGGEITSDAGVLLLRERARRIRLFERMAGCFTDHRDRERLTHTLPALLAQRVCGMALGYEDIIDHDTYVDVCGRPLQCKKEFEQLVTCGQVLSYVRPLKCGMHAPRALMVFVDRIQIAPAVCLTALRVVLVFPTPSL